MASCRVCSTKRSSRMSVATSSGRARVRSSTTQVSMNASLESNTSGAVAFDEKHAVPKHPMHEIRGSAVQDDDVDTNAERAFEFAGELERILRECRRRMIEPDSNIDDARRRRTPAR